MKEEFYKLQTLGMQLVTLSKFIQTQDATHTRKELAIWNAQLEEIKESIQEIQQKVNDKYLK